jgi:hypothetical protein
MEDLDRRKFTCRDSNCEPSAVPYIQTALSRLHFNITFNFESPVYLTVADLGDVCSYMGVGTNIRGNKMAALQEGNIRSTLEK